MLTVFEELDRLLEAIGSSIILQNKISGKMIKTEGQEYQESHKNVDET